MLCHYMTGEIHEERKVCTDNSFYSGLDSLPSHSLLSLYMTYCINECPYILKTIFISLPAILDLII